MDLRTAAQRQRIAQLLLCGWSATKIAKRLGRTTRAIRYAISTPEFQAIFDEYQRDYFAGIDRQIKHLLGVTISALRRQLRHRDPWVRADAIEKILKVHGRYIERLDLTGRLEHTHQRQLGWWEGPLDDMTDEQRELARKLLRATRPTQRLALPLPRLITGNGEPSAEAS